MKKLLLILMFSTFAAQAQVQTITPTVTPNPFERNQQITITVQGSQINESTWGVTGNALYLWAWMQDANGNGIGDCPTNGSWTSSSETNRMTYNSGSDTYTMTFIPQTFYNNTVFGRMGFLVKAKDGSGDKKTNDNIFNVGAFQVSLSAPAENSITIISTPTNASVVASNSGGAATYTLKANGVTVSGPTTTTFFTAGPLVSQNTIFTLETTQGATTVTKRFTYLFNPGTLGAALPSGMVDGINYDSNDATTATLVLNAPFKDFIYVAGSFNNWQPTAAAAMKKDPTSGKFWLTLTGLTPGQVHTYQYWVCDVTSRPTNSPAVVKTADPFSTLVLSPFDDPEIATLGVFPNLPTYPTGQEREVSVLQTGSNTLFSYNWSSATTNFVKPKKKDLVFYEILVRDFDANRSYQDLINKIDYFKNLNINAIKIMPVMEFEGNLSWGYNTVFHMALDKRYGPPAKLKEFIDLCHQNGIAVILDLALNHVFGRSPLERMWMLDTDGDGWANGTGFRVSSENPYVNQDAMHSYSVGSDLNHFRETGIGGNLTNTYAIRAIQYWINEFKIDGYRWDLTKGFTQQCPPNVAGGQETCTNGYRSDRVAKMKWYADNQWAADPNSLVIFEHLGTGGSSDEENEWANYQRSGDNKGIMQWRKMTDPYANLLKGNFGDISGVAESTSRFIGYAESHDEERVVYKALNEAGQTQGNLAKVLQRLPAMGSMLFMVPGPKMMWHFGELGWDKSLFTCSNGTVQFNDGCKLDTKPQPQWTENWLNNPARANVYNQWARQIDIRINEDVFENGQYSWNFNAIGSPRIDVWTSTSQTAALSYVFVRTNFSDNTLNTSGGFPFTGMWYNLIDNTPVNVTSLSQNISIEPGGYRVYGNKQSSLSSQELDRITNLSIYPNPTSGTFSINHLVTNVEIYSITGQLVKSFDSIPSENYQFDVNDLSNGVYLVKAVDENNSSKTMKLIKQ